MYCVQLYIGINFIRRQPDESPISGSDSEVVMASTHEHASSIHPDLRVSEKCHRCVKSDNKMSNLQVFGDVTGSRGRWLNYTKGFVVDVTYREHTHTHTYIYIYIYIYIPANNRVCVHSPLSPYYNREERH